MKTSTNYDAKVDELYKQIGKLKVANDFCIEALEEAISKYDCPEIFNTDQGSQFTSKSFTKVFKKNHIQISIDSRGRFQDNIFIERL